MAGAAFWAMVHELMTGQQSKYGTPLELLALPFVSPYAVRSHERRRRQPRHSSVSDPRCPRWFTPSVHPDLCQSLPAERRGRSPQYSPRGQLRTTNPEGRLFGHNSLLAAMVLVLRGYCEASEIAQLLLSDLPAPKQVDVKPDISTYSLLCAGWGNVAAVDFESKLVRSVANINLTDLRNYAHGRYHWLERHGKTTALVSLITPEWAPLLDRTLEHLSPSVEVIRLQASHEGPLGAIELVVEQMRLFGQIAANAWIGSRQSPRSRVR